MAAAAVAETVALRARPEPGIRPGGPSLLRTPAEPSSALAGRGCLLPGKQMRALRGPGVRGRGTRCQFGRPAPGTGLRSRGSCGPAPPERAAPSAPRSRGGVWLGGGLPGGPRAQGAGSRPPGPRDRFVYEECGGQGAAGVGSAGGRGDPGGAEDLWGEPG